MGGYFGGSKKKKATPQYIDREVIKALYEDKVQEALTAAHIPPYIGVTLTASSTKAAEFGVVEGDEDLFSTETTETCKFTKPRNVKEA